MPAAIATPLNVWPLQVQQSSLPLSIGLLFQTEKRFNFVFVFVLDEIHLIHFINLISLLIAKMK